MIHTFSFQQDVDRFIDHREALDRRKKQMLFKKWSERVYSPVKVHITYILSSLLLYDQRVLLLLLLLLLWIMDKSKDILRLTKIRTNLPKRFKS